MTRRILAGLLPVLTAAGGCLSKPALVPQIFSIDPPPVEKPRRSAGAYVVSVKRVQVSPLFDGRDLLYRTGEHRLERDPYASFAAPPADILTGAVRGYLGNASFALDVVEPGGEPRADLSVEVYAAEISGDLRRADDAAAVLRLRFLVMAGGAERHRAPPLFEKEYASRTRVPKRTAEAIATAWNEGLSGIMKEFVGDIEAVLARAPMPSGAAARP
jgi:cholesterol transport system auxiliary component